MKAIVYTEFGPPEVLQLKEVDKPTPRDDEVLIKVFATTVSAADVNARGFVFVHPRLKLVARLMLGVRSPINETLGKELAGEVESIGKNVRRFREGDAVFGMAGGGFGAYAEYIILPEDSMLAAKPANLSFEEAAAIPFGAHAALFFLRDKANLQSGQKAIIYGASGSVGTAAVQLANYYGAEVTGVCSSANVELVKALGADKVIDYTVEDFTQSGETYDIIFDTVGKTSFSGCQGSLKQNGIYLAAVGGPQDFAQTLWSSIRGGKKAITGVVPERADDLEFIKELAEAGALKPVIDRRYPLEQAADAHRYVDMGHKKGNVVITVGNERTTRGHR